jgi:hypothetical protein
MKSLAAFLLGPTAAFFLAIVLLLTVFATQALIDVTIVDLLRINPQGHTILTMPWFGLGFLIVGAAAAMGSLWFRMLLIRNDMPDVFCYSAVFLAGLSALMIPLIGETQPEYYPFWVILMDMVVCAALFLFSRRVGGGDTDVRQVINDASH